MKNYEIRETEPGGAEVSDRTHERRDLRPTVRRQTPEDEVPEKVIGSAQAAINRENDPA